MKMSYPKDSLDKLCGLFGITRQAYYQHMKRGVHNAVEEELVIKQVLDIRKDHPRMEAESCSLAELIFRRASNKNGP